MTTKPASSDVVIVGAGITGVSSALALAEQGASVLVIERYQPAAMASGWTLAGVRQSGRDPAELLLAQRAVALWQTLDEQLAAPTGYRQTGNLRLARTDKEAEVIRQLVENQRQAGLDIELLNASELHSRLPILEKTLRCASLCRSDGQADPQATSLAYRQAAERLGVRFFTETSVREVIVRAGRYHSLNTSAGTLSSDSCILATGIQTNDLLQPLGLYLPMKWALVCVMQSTPQPPMISPVIGVANADLALRQQADGCLRMTGGAEYTDVELIEDAGLPRIQTTRASMNIIKARIAKVLPAVSNVRVAKHWGGLLDMTPDGLPVIDSLPDVDGLFVASGFSGHGFGIGPAVGEAIAELVLKGRTSLPLKAFAYDRFGHQHQSTPQLHG